MSKLYEYCHKPPWKIMGRFFETNYLSFIFVVYFSFDTRHTWCGRYELCWFSLDVFYHQLDRSDILKKTIRSKPDVALVWPMPCAWMTSRYGQTDRYWRIVWVQEVGIKVLHITENLSSYTSRLICDPPMMSAVERSYPKPWLEECSIVPGFVA